VVSDFGGYTSGVLAPIQTDKFGSVLPKGTDATVFVTSALLAGGNPRVSVKRIGGGYTSSRIRLLRGTDLKGPVEYIFLPCDYWASRNGELGCDWNAVSLATPDYPDGHWVVAQDGVAVAPGSDSLGGVEDFV
jgi:hypothetical protein